LAWWIFIEVARSRGGAANICLLGEDGFARDVRAGRIHESEWLAVIQQRRLSAAVSSGSL